MAGVHPLKTNGWSGHLTAVALAAFLTYINTLNNGFVLDDFGLILFNDAVRTFDAAFLLTSDYWAGYEGRISGLYRPLTTLSLALEFHLWGERPELFHLTNTLLHAANALLVYSLGRHLGKAAIGLGAGLLFATHPLHSEAVAYVAGRADLLASLFALAALNCSLRARQTGKTRWRALAVLALAPGLLCKEQAAIVPGLLLGMDWLLWRQGRLKRWPWAEYGAHILVLSVYLCARYAALDALTIASIDFLDNPLAILETWKGGMSFHGGLLGVITATLLFCRYRKIPVLEFGDVVAAAAPIGLFLGRVANFINGELFGRATDVPWAMVFPHGGPVLRHPTQIYEALLEGVVLFAMLFILARREEIRKRPGTLIGVFLAGYAIARIIVEFFRQPDAQIGLLLGGSTMGQWLSVPMFVVGVIFLVRARPKVVPA